MPAQIEAPRLSGIDHGKHVRLMVPGGRYTGDWELAGELISLGHYRQGEVTITVLREDGPAMGSKIPPGTIVTITGTAS